MPPSASERRIRAGLPVIRFFQAYVPLSVAGRLNKLGTACARLPSGVQRQAESADGVPCVWLTPAGSSPDRVLLYFHGGGFVYGQTPLHLAMVAHLAPKLHARALLVDYRVGPANPFPAALDDCATSYRWLLKQGFSPENIVLAGDSAGGNLVITTLMKLRDAGEPLPAAAACLSPAVNLAPKVNLAHTGEPARRQNDPLLHPKAMKLFHTSYLGDRDATDPLISPVYGDWHGLPPLLVHAGTDEVLREDAVRIGELAAAAGVDVRVEIYPGMWHVWQLFLALPQATESLDDIAAFLGSHLGPRENPYGARAAAR